MAKKKAEEKEKIIKNEEIDVDLLKEELSSYIDESVKRSVTLELEKSYKRTIRDKNIKLLIRNMIITALLLVIVYLIYVLNENDYFDKFFIEENTREKTIEVTDKKDSDSNNKSEEPKEPTLEELKEQYAYLLDNIYINEESVYTDDYYNGRLTDNLKNYLTMNFIDIDSLTKEENYNVIEDDTFKKYYEKKFITEHLSQSFNYNGNNFRYIAKLDSYITDRVVEKNSTNIKKLITKINLDNDNVKITTVEGLVKDNKLYNILTDKEVADYSSKSMLENIDKLNRVIYTFNKDGKLINLNS